MWLVVLFVIILIGLFVLPPAIIIGSVISGLMERRRINKALKPGLDALKESERMMREGSKSALKR